MDFKETMSDNRVYPRDSLISTAYTPFDQRVSYLEKVIMVLKAIGTRVHFPSLADFFKSCCLQLKYIPNGAFTSYNLTWFLYFVSFPNIILGTLRFAFLGLHVHDPYYSTLLADPSFFMGNTSIWFLATLVTWFTAAVVNRVYHELSNYNTQYQYWVKPMIYLEHPEYTQDPSTQNGSRLTLLILRFNQIASVSCAMLVHIPILLEFPIKWLPVTLLITLMTGFHGYLVCCYEVNITILTAYYLYLYGRRYHRLADQAIVILHSSTLSANSGQRFLIQFKKRMIRWTREMFKVNKFIARIMSVVFVATFVAQTLCLYLIFFVGLEGSTKYIIQLLGFLTILYGQVICFVSGSYGQHRYNECVTQLHHLIESKAMQIPLSLRLKSLITSEYLTDRRIFTLMATIEVSTVNFIKVQVEIAMLLLLLIGNAKSSL